MPTNETIKKDIQNLTPGQLIELYTIDLSPIGISTTYRFTPGNIDGGFITYNGIIYINFPVETEGFETNSEGKMPRPLIRVSNVNMTLLGAVVNYNDLVGCKLIRRRTFSQYLDGQPSADPDAQFPIDVYYINRKTKQNKLQIEFELVSILDVEGKVLPAKKCLESCTHRYRIYVDGSWDRTDVTCPYNEEIYFTDSGATTANPLEDNCGRRLYDCKLRFGTQSPLPYEGFPNIAKFDVNFKAFRR